MATRTQGIQAAIISLVFGLLGSAVRADLLGDTVKMDYRVPNLNTVSETMGQQTITAIGETYHYLNFPGPSSGYDPSYPSQVPWLDLLVKPTSIKVTNVFTAYGGQARADLSFYPDAFNGFSITDLTGPSNPITEVTLDPSSDLAGFDGSHFSFTDNNVLINLQGLDFFPDTILLLNLKFRPDISSPSVPEPNAFAMLLGLSGAGGLFLLRRRRK